MAQALVSRDGTVIAGEYYRTVTAPQSDSLPILPRRYSNLPLVKPRQYINLSNVSRDGTKIWELTLRTLRERNQMFSSLLAKTKGRSAD